MSDFAGSLTVVAAFRSSVMHHAHAKVYDESDYSKTPDPVDAGQRIRVLVPQRLLSLFQRSAVHLLCPVCP
jgi:hypothetical protein